MRGNPDPEVWARVAEAWYRLGQPYPASYARLRSAAALLSMPRAAGRAAEPLRRAHAGACALGAAPLCREVERLARFAAIDLPYRAATGAGTVAPHGDDSAREGATSAPTVDVPTGQPPAVPAQRSAGTQPAVAPAEAPAGSARLTPRELQVLALVASGASNRQIARQLFISEKTAGVHVSNILAKLGARSRTAAAATAHRLGVLEA